VKQLRDTIRGLLKGKSLKEPELTEEVVDDALAVGEPKAPAAPISDEAAVEEPRNVFGGESLPSAQSSESAEKGAAERDGDIAAEDSPLTFLVEENEDLLFDLAGKEAIALAMLELHEVVWARDTFYNLVINKLAIKKYQTATCNRAKSKKILETEYVKEIKVEPAPEIEASDGLVFFVDVIFEEFLAEEAAHTGRVDDWVDFPGELEDLHSGDNGVTMQEILDSIEGRP
jgi:hypothetical protein